MRYKSMPCLHTDCLHLAQETLDQLQPASHVMSCHVRNECSGLTYHGRLGLKAAGMGLPVRPDHAVDAELGIVWEATKVPSISPVLHCFTCMLTRVLIGMITYKPWIRWHAFKLNRKPGTLLPTHLQTAQMTQRMYWRDHESSLQSHAYTGGL